MATTFSRFRIFNPGAAPLIASLCRICKVQETIDQMVQWRETARLSAGQVAEAIIINILCGRRPLWKMEQFFDEIDLALLYGNGISPEHLNDDVLGRCLDKLGEIDLDKLVSHVGMQALLEHSLSLRVVHIDSTSVSVEGEYVDQDKDADFLINHGHSKDRRNDLKQFKFGLACQERGMIVGGQLLAQAFEKGDPAGELAQKAADLHKQWLTYYWSEYSKEDHAGLAQMYVDDERFRAYYDEKQPGTAAFFKDAILIYTGMNK